MNAHDETLPLNFRDVGAMLSIWDEVSPLPEGQLFRGGKLDPLVGPTLQIPVGTVVNLRTSADVPIHGTQIRHCPAPRGFDRYHTHRRPVRVWVAGVLALLNSTDTRWPVYVHCASGRDRTGVIIAAALLSIGVGRERVEQEYALSDCPDLVAIRTAIDGLLANHDWRPKWHVGPLAVAAARGAGSASTHRRTRCAANSAPSPSSRVAAREG